MQSKKPRPQAKKRKLSGLDRSMQKILGKPFFKQVLQEWAEQVNQGGDPRAFAHRYRKWMSDPMDFEARQVTTIFANFMSCRNWQEVRSVLGPKLDKGVLRMMKTPAAASFYPIFQIEVMEGIREYWKKFIAARKAAQRRAAPRSSPRRPRWVLRAAGSPGIRPPGR